MTQCPRCGAGHEPGLEYCLECGEPLRRRTRIESLREKVAGSVWPALVVLLLAGLGALVAIAVSRGEEDKPTLVATRLPARTTVPTLPVFGTESVASTALPVVTTPTPLPPPPPTSGPSQALTEWTRPDGYTLVLASIPFANGKASAVQIAKRALSQGLRDVGVLDSKDFSGLAPGFFVVFTGVYDTNADAAAHIGEAERAGFTAPYARRVTR
jgi:hypothetical protein